MSKNKNKNVESKGNETVKEVKKAPFKIASAFIRLAKIGAKDREELAEKIMAEAKALGVEKNIRGKIILKARVLQQISAMLRDIRTERGKDTKSWWSQYTIVEDDKQVKIVPR